MKTVNIIVKVMIMVIVSAILYGCAENSAEISRVSDERNDNSPVLEEADYVSNTPLEWYNFLHESETYSLIDEQKYYSAILNASNGIFNKYAKYSVKDTGNIIIPTTNVYTYIAYDYPQLRFLEYRKKNVEDDNYYTIEIVNEEEYNEKISQIDSVIKDLVDEVNKETSLITKYRIINDWIVKNVEYDFKFADFYDKESGEHTAEEYEYIRNCNAFNIYGAIVEKKAVCSGISEAFKYICSKCNLDCMVVTGMVGEDGHAWNVVPIYGNYFLIDCTWELESYIEYGSYWVNDEYTGARTLKEVKEYDYFLLNDLWVSGRTIENEEVDKFFREEQEDWTIDGNIAKSSSGITIEIPDDYKFIPQSGSQLAYGLTDDGYDKLFAGEEVDSISFNLNEKIEHVIFINDYSDKQLESVKDFVNKNQLTVNDTVTSCMIVVKINGEMHTIKLKYCGM